MKCITHKIILSILILHLFTGNLFAANLYVLPGGAGDRTGADFTNAIDMPDGWKGTAACTFDGAIWPLDSVYVIGGSDTAYSYGPCLRLTSGSGALTFRKANATQDSGVAGWNADYGTKQAVIGKVHVWLIDNVTFDGVAGSGTTGYGFEFNDLVFIGDSGANRRTGIVFKYSEFTHSDGHAIQSFPSSAAATADAPNVMITNNYFHDIGGLAWSTGNIVSTYIGQWQTFQNNIVERIGQTDSTGHKEIIKMDGVDNTTIRNNTFRDWQGCALTGGLILSCAQTHGSSGTHIYNNLFYYTGATCPISCPIAVAGGYSAGGGNRLIGVTSSCGAITYDDIKIYNNTVYNVNVTNNCGTANGANVMTDFGGGESYTNSSIKNNLFDSNLGLAGIGMGDIEVDYNWYKGNTNYTIPESESHSVVGVADPFTDSAKYDFTLAAGSTPIGAGANLSAIFTTDKSGATRSVPWDIGAYEYTSGVTTYTLTVAKSGTGATTTTGAQTVEEGAAYSISVTRHNGWNGAWSTSDGTNCVVSGCTVPNEGATGTCSVTVNADCTVTYTATEIKLLPW